MKVKTPPATRFRRREHTAGHWQRKAKDEENQHRKVAASLSDDGLFAARMDLMGRELKSYDPADRWAIARLAAIQKEAEKRSLTF